MASRFYNDNGNNLCIICLLMQNNIDIYILWFFAKPLDIRVITFYKLVVKLGQIKFFGDQNTINCTCVCLLAYNLNKYEVIIKRPHSHHA